MKRLTTLIVLAASIGLASELSAHGGTYKGPGDTVPPGGGGASTPAPPSTPSSPSTPSTPSSPSTPSTPNTPNTPSTPSTPAGPNSPTTGQQADSTDLSTWQFWWEFNKDRFLNLRAKVHGVDATTDAAGALTGLGAGAQQANTSAPSEQQILTMVLPALHAAVKEEQDQDILTGVMIALAKCGRETGDEARKLFTENLDAPVQEVAETAAVSFGILKNPQGMKDVLMPLLKNDATGRKLVGKNEVPLRTRTFAAYGIALIGSHSSDPELKRLVAATLLEALKTDKSSSQDIRVASLIGMGLLNLKEPADIANLVGELSAYLRDGKDDDIVLAHVPNALAKLLRGLPADDLTLRNQVLDQIIEQMDGRSKAGNFTRMSCCMALGMLARPNDPRSKDIFDALVDASEKAKDQQVKNFSAISLAYLGSADPTFDSKDNKQPVTKFMLGKLKKSNTSYEMWTGLALGVMLFQLNEQGLPTDPAVQEEVLKKLEEAKSAEQLSAYALALGLMKYESAIEVIREKMDQNTTSEFLGYGSIALGLLQARSEANFLLTLIEEKKRDEDLLKQAAIGLGLMKEKRVINTLLKFMNPDSGKPTLAVLASTATALGFIGDQSSVAPLVETMQNKKLTALGRAFAAVALGMVGDPSTMPWNSRIGEDMNYRASVSTLVEKSVSNGILDIL